MGFYRRLGVLPRCRQCLWAKGRPFDREKRQVAQSGDSENGLQVGRQEVWLAGVLARESDEKAMNTGRS